MNIRIALLCAVALTACAQEVPAPREAAPQNAAAAASATTTAQSVPAGDPRIALAAKIPAPGPKTCAPRPVPGIFELMHGTDISYITADAAYVFAGDMYKVSTAGDFPNLSEARRREARLELLARVPESQMLVFGSAKAAHTVTIFSDIDCPWCRKLHSQIDDYNKLGMRVRYMFFPRSGPDTESWAKAETVWCSADRNAAFTSAKLGKDLPLKKCPDAPVALEYKLGQDLGITAHPAWCWRAAS